MKTGKEYIDSGILEQYVLGCTSAEVSAEVELMAVTYPEVQQEIDLIEASLEAFAMEYAVEPSTAVKPLLMAAVDYTERLKNGEPVTFPPLLNENSTIADFAPWLNRTDMVAPEESTIYAKIIGYTPQASTAIIWLNDATTPEVHENEFEKFLVVEGTCNITVGDEVHKLVPGDYFAIPLYKNHIVKVTSNIRCKIILQRVAA